MNVQITDIGNICRDVDEIPVDYCWSGYTKTITEFEKGNFLITSLDEQEVLICSPENVIALCEYICSELINQPFLRDMEDIYSPGYDIWFYLK